MTYRPAVADLAMEGALLEIEHMFDPENLVQEIERDQGLFERFEALKPEVASVEDVQEALHRLIPNLTFQEAYESTGRHLNVSIAAAEKHQTSRLLNSITTPNVYVREAVMASAAVPGFYPPVALAAKNAKGKKQPYLPSRRWVDGSLSDDLPAKRLARIYGVKTAPLRARASVAAAAVDEFLEVYRPKTELLAPSARRTSGGGSR